MAAAATTVSRPAEPLLVNLYGAIESRNQSECERIIGLLPEKFRNSVQLAMRSEDRAYAGAGAGAGAAVRTYSSSGLDRHYGVFSRILEVFSLCSSKAATSAITPSSAYSASAATPGLDRTIAHTTYDFEKLERIVSSRLKTIVASRMDETARSKLYTRCSEISGATCSDVARLDPKIIARALNDLNYFLSRDNHLTELDSNVLERVMIYSGPVHAIHPYRLMACARLQDKTVVKFKAPSGFTDDDLKYVIECYPNLRELDLTKACITDRGLAELRMLTSLTSLNLARCRRPLNSLDLTGYYRITDAGLAHLSGLTSLTSLNLDGCYRITDAGLTHLSRLTSLTSLNLGWCSITDAGLEHLSRLTALTSLNLTGCSSITDTGLTHLSRLTALTSLNLDGCRNITDVGLAHLCRLTALTSLNLDGCRNITDVGLAHLSGLTALSSLSLNQCIRITDASLEHLSRLTALTTLNLRACRLITDAGVERLQAAIRASIIL